MIYVGAGLLSWAMIESFKGFKFIKKL